MAHKSSPRAARSLPPIGGEGRGKGADARSLADAHLTLPHLCRGPLPLPPEGRRGKQDTTTAEAAPITSVHAGAVDLEPGFSGEEALRRIGAACLDQISANEAAILAGMPEGVHQMRVAVRRLRAILVGFGPMLPADQRRSASRELRWLGDVLGPARNLDVLETALIAPARSALVEPARLRPRLRRGIAALSAAAERQRGIAYAKAAKAIRSKRYTALMARLRRRFEGGFRRKSIASQDLRQPIAALAARILDRRRLVVMRHGKGFAAQSARERHRLRIALKKLRYATEMLGGMYDAAMVRHFTKPLRRLQDDLGEANDVRVGHLIIAELAGPDGAVGAIAAAGKIVLEWHEERLARREPKLRQHLGRLLETEPFWTG